MYRSMSGDTANAEEENKEETNSIIRSYDDNENHPNLVRVSSSGNFKAGHFFLQNTNSKL